MTHQPIASVTTGMRVVDSSGEDIGEVEAVKMGDPEAVTTQGQRVGEPFDLIDAVGRALIGPEPYSWPVTFGVHFQLNEWRFSRSRSLLSPGLTPGAPYHRAHLRRIEAFTWLDTRAVNANIHR